LHLKEGLAAIKEKVGSGKVVRPAPSNLNGGANRRAPLISSPYFAVDMFELKEPHSFRTQDETGKHSVQILVAVEGCGIVEAAGTNPVTLARGDAVVVPAAVGEFQVRPQWSVEFLKASVPGGPVPEPETRM
jgi:mannose-6-phosphate isomerase class I